MAAYPQFGYAAYPTATSSQVGTPVLTANRNILTGKLECINSELPTTTSSQISLNVITVSYSTATSSEVSLIELTVS